jgi:chemotaxis protein histidine kinase CheA
LASRAFLVKVGVAVIPRFRPIVNVVIAPQTTEAKGGLFGTPPPAASTGQLPSSAAAAPFSPFFPSAQAQTPPDSGLFGAKPQSPADGRKESDDKQAKERAAAEQTRAEQEKEQRVRETREAELKARIEAERKEAERREAEKREAERREAERREAERKEAERKETERREAERKEAERREAERREAARKEADLRAAAEREAAKKEREKREREMVKRQAEEVKAAQRDIARFKAAEQKAQEREAMIRRNVEQEVTKRKSMDDEDEEQSTSSSKGKFKAPKLPQTEEPPLRIEELLTGLEEHRPPRSTPGVSKKPLIDEDELLISSARLAAHTLSQRRLFDRDMPQSLASSWSSSRSSPYMSQSYEPSTTSAADGGRAFVNGYEVALAPTTRLGLGQSLSRTEQRIRLTGAKGLASKPIAPLLRSTSTKESSKSKSKSKRPRRNYSSSFGS